MSKNQSRRERRRQKNLSAERRTGGDRGGLSKIYYWIIGILFLILVGLVVFIFTRNGDDVKLADDNDEPALVQDADNAADEEATTEEPENESTSEEVSSNEESTEADESAVEEETEDTEEAEETEDAEDIAIGESTTVTEDAPHDPSHTTNYNDGSADRVAIKNQVMQATGLGNDLIEWWIGNDGPGRVTATVSNPDRSRIYRVYLQYGDGNWHVTDYERLDSVPNN